MNSTEPDLANNTFASPAEEAGSRNYYALFDKPSPENLAANQRGSLTPEQRRDITRRVAAHKSYIFLIFGLGFFSVLFIFFLMWRTASEQGVNSFTNLLVSGGVITFLLGLFVLVLAGDIFLLFVPNDPGDDQVESTIGRVVWKGNRYGVHSDARQLRSMRLGLALPPPGLYRFYYLFRTGLVVMAEEAVDLAEEQPTSMLFQSLARANHFSAEDMIQNREGLLSKNQENRLLGSLALFTFVVLSGLTLSGSIVSQMLRGHFSTLFLLLLVIGGTFLLRFGWSTVKLIRDLWNGKVSSVQGPGTRLSHKYRYFRSYYYVISGHRFSVSGAAYNALLEGKQYRIYYAPHSKQLVSIEPI